MESESINVSTSNQHFSKFLKSITRFPIFGPLITKVILLGNKQNFITINLLNEFTLWDLQTLKPLKRFNNTYIFLNTYNNVQLLCLNYQNKNELLIFNLLSTKLEHNISLNVQIQSALQIDLTIVAIGTNIDVKIWNLSSNNCLITISNRFQKSCEALAKLPNSNLLACGSNSDVNIYDMDNPEEPLSILYGCSGRICYIAPFTDGKRLLRAAKSKWEVWDWEEPACLYKFASKRSQELLSISLFNDLTIVHANSYLDELSIINTVDFTPQKIYNKNILNITCEWNKIMFTNEYLNEFEARKIQYIRLWGDYSQ